MRASWPSCFCTQIVLPREMSDATVRTVQKLLSPKAHGDLLEIAEEGNIFDKDTNVAIQRRIAAPRVTASAHRLVTFNGFGIETIARVASPLRCRSAIPQEPYIERGRPEEAPVARAGR
eukprot:GEMP01077782.1.p1 GENE.GEMP01077782.1~~GEMP01077782.1.p1  ORF type:complete len:119 (+),score=34.02 GEMP01077782.1:227-583(+)